MGRKDWYYVHLPKLLTKRLDQFLETPRARSMGMSNKPELLRHVINDFLEEQEGFYKNLESINDFILQIRDRDHLALIYNEKSQFEEIVGTFIRRGINYNQINILVISKREESQFIQSLNKIEKIDSLFNSQDIMIILTDECSPDESYPDQIVVNQGDKVILHFIGVLGVHHIITVDGVGTFALHRGEIHTVSFIPTSPGTINFFCSVHLPNMVGQILVLPKSA